MLDHWQVSGFYVNSHMTLPGLWNPSRKHVRIQMLNGRFVKLNKFENRLNPRELKEYCVTLQPLHLYFSVLNWLFPERVGKKYKANYAVPVGSGEYVVDIDSHVMWRWHEHYVSRVYHVCQSCLELSRRLTIQACEEIERYYSDIAVVFSGRSGFHILDFAVADWTRVNYEDLVKLHEAARFKFSKIISLQTYCYDRAHFILSVDPMRVITVPETLNAETGLKCVYVGIRTSLEALIITDLLGRACPVRERYGYPEPRNQGAVKQCA